MRFIYVVLLLLILQISNFFGQKSDTIYWSCDSRLKQSDFYIKNKKLCECKDALAISYTSISAKVFFDHKGPNYSIKVFFLRSKSCASDILDSSDIDHEQLHFDITELYARKMRKKVRLLRYFNISSSWAYESNIRRLIKCWKIEEENYDRKTSHGHRIEKQKLWSNKIEKRLQRFIEYSI